MEWKAAPGTSRTEMARITDRVAEELRGLPGVRDVGAHIGRAVTSDQVSNVDSGELWATLRDGADYQDTVDAVESVVTGYPGMAAEVLTYGDERCVLGASEPRTPRRSWPASTARRPRCSSTRRPRCGLR